MIGDIKKIRFWCQKVIPLVYDNSLSYYEVLCKVVDYLNKVIEDMNEIPSYIDAKIEEALDDEHLKELIEEVVANIESAISSNNEHDNTNSSADYNIGQMLWWNGKLYKVIRTVDAGDTFILDTNIELVNFEDLFNDFVDEVKHDISANDDGTNATASNDWNKGQLVWLNDNLYIVTKNITEGNAYVFSGDNANVREITIEELLNGVTDAIKHGITSNDDGINTVASQPLTEGEWIWLDNILYVVLSDIAEGDAYVFSGGSANVREITVEELNSVVYYPNTKKIIIHSKIDDYNELGEKNYVDSLYAIDSNNNPIDVLLSDRETRLKLDNLDIVNVKDYGALGDGVTDDTTAIMAAIAYAQSSDVCKLVYFPSGIYRITDSITIEYVAGKNLSSVSLLGAGMYNTQILCDGDFDGIVYRGDDTVAAHDGYLYGFFIKDLYIHYAGNDSTKTGLTIEYAGAVSVENVRIRYFKTGVYLTGCGNSLFSHIGISANVAEAVGFDVGELSVSNYYVSCFFAASGNASGLTADSIGFKLVRGTIADQNINYFDVGGSATSAIFINGVNQISGQQHGDINITDLVCETYYGIQAYNLDVHPNLNIIGGWFNNTGERFGIALTNCSGVMIRDAVFVFNSQVLYNNKGAVVVRDANCDNITIMGCLCRNQYLFNGAAGGENILIANNQVTIDAAMEASLVGVNGDRCIVQGNIFKGAPIRYVRAYSGATNSLVVNNIGSGEASGTAFQNDAGETTTFENNVD